MRSRSPVGRLTLAAAAAVAVVPILGVVGCSSESKPVPVATGQPTMASAKSNTDPAARPPTNIPGVDRTTTALAGVRALRDELTEDKTKTDNVLAALAEVVQGQGDLVPAFQKFTTGINELKATVQRDKQIIDEMRAKTRDYIVGWEVEVLGVDDVELRRQSDQRRAEVRSDYTRINETIKAQREAYEALEQRLSGLYIAMSYDLTPRGVTAADAAVKKANQDGAEFKQKTDAVIKELDRVSGLMTPAGPASRPVGG